MPSAACAWHGGRRGGGRAEDPPAAEPAATPAPEPSPAPASAPVAVAPAAAIAPTLDGADPLVFRPSARVVCRTATGSLNGCRVRVTARGKLIASGSGRGSGNAVAVRLKLTAYGRRVLGRTLGGVSARVQASTAGRSWTVKLRALNATERFVTPAGSFAPDQAEMTARGERYVARMTARLRAVRGVRCDGYSAGDTIARSNALALSRDRAKTVCAGLSGARIVGHGTSAPIARNASDAGRAKNRRVVVTVRH